MSRVLGTTVAIQGGATVFRPECSLYGALELKRSYQKNMLLGIVFAATLHLVTVAGLSLYRHLTPAAIVAPMVRLIDDSAKLDPLPRIGTAVPQARIKVPDLAPPEIGIPTPVPDVDAPPDVRFITRKELADLNPQADASVGDTPEEYVIVSPSEADSEYFPAPGEFVMTETLPVRIDEQQLVYPEVAALTGTEGVVIVEALVDREGRVREARVVKPSGSSVGFEQAALVFAHKHLYKPAIQNGRPVAVRITYRVEFRLKQK